ncbi:MAG: type IV pilin N-terminal domain-containing protein [Methanocorpusculum sp.]|jgi:FlaG/FlaF family flagellin (archaellin)|uniref:type IV pilin N-terminal domain-containing protein n=1 Tax=Methanocorpusculum sp. TaxID=2058474 RepID=UPI002720CC7C|nr:type IV pilin N-terminal domain-containing protein [Methanocorpusculum sp.]MDO9523027.1 type IV pilin N-terminal domain-containing protein [Methanocorpusculum sp.]
MKKDDGVTSVVGEMLLLVIALVLVSVFAVSILGLIPGDREEVVNVGMNPSVPTETIYLWHKGGDWIDKDDLTIAVYNGIEKRNVTFVSLTNQTGYPTEIFQLGGCLTYTVESLSPGDEVRLSTQRSTIFSGVVP